MFSLGYTHHTGTPVSESSHVQSAELFSTTRLRSAFPDVYWCFITAAQFASTAVAFRWLIWLADLTNQIATVGVVGEIPFFPFFPSFLKWGYPNSWIPGWFFLWNCHLWMIRGSQRSQLVRRSRSSYGGKMNGSLNALEPRGCYPWKCMEYSNIPWQI